MLNETVKIVIVSRSDLTRAGRLSKMAATLADNGAQVILVGQAQRDSIQIDGVQILSMPTRSTSKIDLLLDLISDWFSANFNKYFKVRSRFETEILTAVQSVGLLEDGPDWVLAHHWTSLGVAKALKDLTGCNVIYDVSENAIRSHIARRKFGRFIDKLASASEMRLIRYVDIVISPAPKYLERVLAIADRELPRFLIRNTVVNPPKQKLNESQQPHMRIIYQGLATNGRGLNEMIHALSELPDKTHLTLQVIGNRDNLSRLKDEINKVGLVEKVNFRLPVKGIDLPIEVANGDYTLGLCFLDPDNKAFCNALPNKLFDYMSAGTIPIVCKGTAAAEHLAGSNCCLIVEQYDSRSLATALSCLSSEQEKIRKMRQACLTFTQRNLWDAETEKFIKKIL